VILRCEISGFRLRSVPRALSTIAGADSRLTVLALVAGLGLWVFSSALLSSQRFAYRDTAHYYDPLFQLVAEEWGAGRVPLWNPYENLGQPLAGDPTASVFYPGKLVFALGLGHAWALKLYVIGHVMLAAWGAYRLARRYGTSVEGAGVCALSYAFSGSVLMNYCNVVFLVGAAWLPLAVLAADRTLVARSPRWAVGFGAVLGLMVLGGDPQTAYHAGLLAALYAAMLFADRGGRTVPISVSTNSEPSPSAGVSRLRIVDRLRRSRAVLLVLAAAVGLALSAVQVVPSLEFSRRSSRNTAGIGEALAAQPKSETYLAEVYDFSVGPWRLAEFVWPNASGRQFPIHRRWLEVLPAEGRIWTPSLYMGILPLLLAAASLRFRGAAVRQRWLSWSVVLAVAASFGWYGPVWWMREVLTIAGAEPGTWPLGPPAGGAYWLMTVALPGYVQFRYPAKLLVVAALGLSALAAMGWDRVMSGADNRFRRGLLVLAGLSGALALAALAVRPLWHGWLSGVEPDAAFGPLDTAGAANDLLAGLVQTAVLCCAGWWLIGRKAARLALAAVAMDLAAANAWMVVCAPEDCWTRPTKAAAALDAAQPTPEAPPRVWRRWHWLAPPWKDAGSPARLAQVVAWERDTLAPKFNLPERIAVIESYGAMILADYEEFLMAHPEEFSVGRVPPRWTLTPGMLAEYMVLHADALPPGAGKPASLADGMMLWNNRQHLPRAWIAEDERPGERSGAEPGRGGPRADPGRDESCRIVHYDPLRVEIEAELARPGMLVLADQFYPGWRLDVETMGQGTGEIPIVCVDGVLRGASLPAGKHRLIYRYQPASFLWGAITSAAAWFALAAWAAWRYGLAILQPFSGDY